MLMTTRVQIQACCVRSFVCVPGDHRHSEYGIYGIASVGFPYHLSQLTAQERDSNSHITNTLQLVSTTGPYRYHMFRISLRLCIFLGGLGFFKSLFAVIICGLKRVLFFHFVCLFDHGTNPSLCACVWVTPLPNPPNAALKSGSVQRVDQKKLYLYMSKTLPLGNVSKRVYCVELLLVWWPCLKYAINKVLY